jgi:hypothetical protein
VFVNWWTFPVFLPGRTVSAIYFLFLLGWFATAYSVATALTVDIPRPAWAAIAVGCGIAFGVGRNCRVAQQDLASGRVAAFARAISERDRFIRAAVASGDRNPQVSPIHSVPWSFMYIDVTDAPATPINMVFCLYYGLDSIALRPEPAAGGTASR